MATLKVEVVAADRRVWSGEAKAVRARSLEGDLGILPGHQPVLVVLAPGDVVVSTDADEVAATIDGGFLSVDHDNVKIVSETVDLTGAK